MVVVAWWEGFGEGGAEGGGGGGEEGGSEGGGAVCEAGEASKAYTRAISATPAPKACSSRALSQAM